MARAARVEMLSDDERSRERVVEATDQRADGIDAAGGRTYDDDLRYPCLRHAPTAKASSARRTRTVLMIREPSCSHAEVAVTRVLLIGASAGGIEPLTGIVERLPADLPAPVLVVVHIPPDAESRLPEILQRHSPLRVRHAVDGEPLQDGRIFVAPPDRHLMVEDGVVRVVRGPRENRHRPAIDTLFSTAAQAHGRGVIAVILSGASGDGVEGAMIVADRGGVVIVQDPVDALFGNMPRDVLRAVPGAVKLPADRIAAAVGAAFERPTGGDEGPMPTMNAVSSGDQTSSPPPIEPETAP